MATEIGILIIFVINCGLCIAAVVLRLLARSPKPSRPRTEPGCDKAGHDVAVAVSQITLAYVPVAHERLNVFETISGGDIPSLPWRSPTF